MTTAEKLAEVTAQIRKDIPHTMELKEGCWIKQKTSEKDFIFKVVAVKGDFLKCVLGFAEFIFLAKDIVNSPKSFEIIGHDIMLNDVLARLSYLGFLTECSDIDFGGDTFCRSELVYDDDGNFSYKKTTFCEWNLSSPYLKDQPEELIKFLYNLIKE